ncbi:MAG TPA: enoyl-CoA hydratase/isomerase family protein [Verrucomicrobiae bacterium]|jgi:enoyl-CoA hydratase/carnithine racemase|nr:enoyl-CoA hydratase/isomerase family protein [Verrucomicrobiae bacterium]
MADALLGQRDGDITTLTLNRPDINNRLSDATIGELADRIDKAAQEARLIVLKAAGEDFCLGREAMGQRRPQTEAYDFRAASEVIFNCYDAFRRSKAPILGIVQGRAAGFGCALAALCDITLASDKARFQVPEMGHNIMPTIAMSALIDRVPRKSLLYLVYSTEEIGAREALAAGLASTVVAHGALEGAAKDLIDRLKKYPLPAVLAVKEYARFAYGMDTAAANDFAKNVHATINTSSKMRGS